VTKLEIAIQKLERLEKELDEAATANIEHYKQTHGSPVNDKRNARAFFKKAEQIEVRGMRLIKEVEAQKERVAMLKEHKFNLENGLNKNGTIATSVANIETIRGMSGSYNKKRVKELETIIAKAEKDNEVMTAKTKELIESGAVTKWEKKPMYYFVKGLRKVALIINNDGDFYVSKNYPAKTDNDEQFIKNLLM